MWEAWIYATEGGEPEGPLATLPQMLAELGFAPRQVDCNGGGAPLRPEHDGMASGGPPEVALVVGESEICARLDGDDELGDVPIVLAIASEELTATEWLTDGHELIVLPASAAELRARIGRAQRRVRGVATDETVVIGSLEVDLATYQVKIDGRPIDFTHMEYELLKFLVTHRGRVFSREALLSRVWGFDYYGGARTVDVHVRRVRAKLGPEHAARITTVRSVGYLFEKEER